MKVTFMFGILGTAIFAAIPAWATPKPLPFTYGTDTNPKGQGEVEQYVDLVPVFALDANGVRQRYIATQFQTEVEYGITNRVELGLYATLAPVLGGFSAVPSLTEANGVKQRIRWRLADQGDWPIDVALYGEVAENNIEIELEWKLILERRFGKLRLLANAWFEEEFYLDGHTEFVANPTFGMTYQVTPSFAPGIEYWIRYDTGGDWNAGPHHYIGPTMRVALGNFFWTTGLYLRANDIGHRMQAGEDAFGPIWFRSIVGYGF